MSNTETYEYPGHIIIDDLTIINKDGASGEKVVNLYKLQHLVEFDLVEDMFSNFLHGVITVSDSINRISNIPLLGEEYLFINMRTPGKRPIKKLFRIYSITSREILKPNVTQVYRIEFCSLEVFQNLKNQLFLPFSGRIDNIVVNSIFKEYLSSPIDIETNSTKISISKSKKSVLNIVAGGEVSNFISFISPGWTPAQAINWIAARTIPRDNSMSASYLFYETCTGFYFTNLQALYSGQVHPDTYRHSPILHDSTVPSVSEKVNNILALSTPKLQNKLLSTLNGQYANRVVNIDLYNKKLSYKDYDYFSNFSTYKHTENPDNSYPFSASKDTISSATSHVKTVFSHDHIFGINEALNTPLRDIYGQRISLLQSLRNIIFNLTVYGKTDLQTGIRINFEMPDISTNESKSDQKADRLYSGKYLITSLRHKIVMIQGKPNHTCILEIVKDDFKG